MADPVSGVGDKAMYESFSQALHVLKGDSAIVVTVTDFNVSPDDAKDLAQQLATKMLTHLRRHLETFCADLSVSHARVP